MKGRVIFTYLQDGEERDSMIGQALINCIILQPRWQLRF